MRLFLMDSQLCQTRYPLVNRVQRSGRIHPRIDSDVDGIVRHPVSRGRRACAAGKPVAFSAVIHSLMQPMPHRGNFFHLHLVSDATGETLITVARAAAAQYATVAPIEHIYPLVLTEKQLDRVIAEIETAPGIVLYTLLEETLTTRLEAKCREFGVPCLS